MGYIRGVHQRHKGILLTFGQVPKCFKETLTLVEIELLEASLQSTLATTGRMVNKLATTQWTAYLKQTACGGKQFVFEKPGLLAGS